jgi:type IV pilus assembly protein PilV
MTENTTSSALVTPTHRENGLTRGVARGSVRSQQNGVGLIEVLVAVLVLSIGFLGIAALQAVSLSTNNSAMTRSMATIDTYSILDAMRSDIANAEGGSYNQTVTANNCQDGTNLSGSQLYQWCTRLGKDLGATANTTGAINCTATGDCTITVVFDDSRAGMSGVSNQTVTTRAML